MSVQWNAVICCAVFLISFALPSIVLGDDPDFICGTGLLDPPNILVQVPGDNEVVGRIVFVTFPDLPDTERALPNWADNMATDLTEYIAAMSRGAQTFDLSVLRRPGADSTLAWEADTTAAYYQERGAWGTLNQEIMEEIDSTILDAWVGVEQVFMVHYQCTFGNCGVAGFNQLGFTPAFPGFMGGGTTERMFYSAGAETVLVALNSDRNRENTKQIAGHEYGHRLFGVNHAPGSTLNT